LGKIEYVKAKCRNCKQDYQVRLGMEETSYGHFCPLCIDSWAIIYTDGSTEDRDSETVKDITYKDELQGITHRGKVRV